MSDIHAWFGLTYASYLTLPRSVLQSMPIEWQEQFVALLDELQSKAFDHGIETPRYTVSARDKDGKYITDPFRSYQRGRRDVFKENSTN